MAAGGRGLCRGCSPAFSAKGRAKDHLNWFVMTAHVIRIPGTVLFCGQRDCASISPPEVQFKISMWIWCLFHVRFKSEHTVSHLRPDELLMSRPTS